MKPEEQLTATSLVTRVKLAMKVNIVTVEWKMPRLVKTVQLVSVKVMKDRCRVYHAVPANSTMLQVLKNANHVQSLRTLVKKKETAVVLIAQRVGRPRRAVRNVSRVVREHLVLDVKIVHWVMQEMAPIPIPHSADSADWVKRRLAAAQPNVIFAIRVSLVAALAFVPRAPRGFFKTKKMNRNAWNAQQANFLSMSKRHAVAVIWASTAVPKGIVRRAPLASTKTARGRRPAKSATRTPT